MAPEQVQGASVDHRVDIWAFGCILFEVFTGRSAMPASVQVDLAADAPRAPDLEALRRVAPAAIVQLAERALEPDREQRLADVSEACRVLKSELEATRRHRWFRRPLVVALAGALAGLVALFLLRDGLFQGSEAARPGTLMLGRPDLEQVTHTGTARLPEIRADGSALAWIDGRGVLSLRMRELPSGPPVYAAEAAEARPMRGRAPRCSLSRGSGATKTPESRGAGA